MEEKICGKEELSKGKLVFGVDDSNGWWKGNPG